MRKIELKRRAVAREKGMQELFGELNETRVALLQAYDRFNAVYEPELVDACVYEINAQLARYDYLLRRIKAAGGRAECRACMERSATWV